MGGEQATHTVHAMPLEELRARAREARRLIAQARDIARASFDRHDRGHHPPASGTVPAYALYVPHVPRAHFASVSDAATAEESNRVGLLLDAAQRLLPGIPSLVEERAPASRMKRIESSARRITLRGGEQRALESIERAKILEAVSEDAAALIAEIGRRSSSPFRAAAAEVGSRPAT
jgi:hypothetical protein